MIRADRRQVLAGLGLALAGGIAPARARAPVRDEWSPDAEHRVAGPGGSLYVRVNGNLADPRPPVVFAAGGPGGNFSSFLPLLPLARDRAVVLYDQLDTGRSDRPHDPANWKPARFGAELEAIRSRLGIARWHVVGTSWGGTVALEYGARWPERLASLVLWSPLVRTADWIADANLLRDRLPPALRDALKRCDPPAPQSPACDAATSGYYAEYLARTSGDPRLGPWRKAHPGSAFAEDLYNAMWGPSEFVATGTLATYDGTPLLAKLPGPRTLFLGGQYDEARPERLAGYAARVAGAEWGVIPGAAHAAIADRPGESLGLLRAWFARHDGAA